MQKAENVILWLETIIRILKPNNTAGNSVNYIDPNNPNIDLDAMLLQQTEGSDKVHEKNSWALFAKIMYDALKKKVGFSCNGCIILNIV